jgi:hypothetical protein
MHRTWMRASQTPQRPSEARISLSIHSRSIVSAMVSTLQYFEVVEFMWLLVIMRREVHTSPKEWDFRKSEHGSDWSTYRCVCVCDVSVRCGWCVQHVRYLGCGVVRYVWGVLPNCEEGLPALRCQKTANIIATKGVLYGTDGRYRTPHP